MIEIDSALLSKMALENLIIEVITRQATEYGEFEINLQIKKEQLLDKIKNGSAVIVYCAKENICDVITADDFIKFQKQLIKDHLE
ncbi:hypothetical protein Lnau_2365 [Legionella nautarum]|uniref:Uncharacterized protein n=1 Tax=Legionella nautarum TaxID=45070 RepID=A0A0W0WK53_9GAMM|nr:YheU family protein [Legionella nautarum]KTD32717.1 hypothetical protein Lnau_2365 [Legionella nautarum]